MTENKIISILDENGNTVFLQILHTLTNNNVPAFIVCNYVDRKGNLLNQDPVLFHVDKSSNNSLYDWEISPVEDESIIDVVEKFLEDNLPEDD